MKITKRQLRRLVKEQTAAVTTDAIEDIVMGVLSDEGGAAGLDPIEIALEELEDEDISLPDESIEDLIGNVGGVKRHADGDYVDTTQLEGRMMKITKRQLRRIIKEEKAKLQEMDPASAGMAAARGDDELREMGIDPNMSIFNSDYIYDMFYDEFAEIQPTSPNVPPEAFYRFEGAVSAAVAKLKGDLLR